MPQAFTLVFLRYLRSCGSASLQLTARIHNWSKFGRKSTGSSVSTDWARSTLVRSFFSQFFEVECWWGHFIRSDCQLPSFVTDSGRASQPLRRCVHRTQVDEKFAYKKFGNMYQGKKSTFYTTITRLSEIPKCCSQTMRALLSQYSCAFGDRLLYVLYT